MWLTDIRIFHEFTELFGFLHRLTLNATLKKHLFFFFFFKAARREGE